MAEATDGNQALQLIAERPLDVTLVHHTLTGPPGVSTMARLAQEHPGLRVVLLSASTDPEDVHRALRAGATGYLLRDADRLELQLALRAVARGHLYLSPAALTPILARFAGSPRASTPTKAAGLTPRQREVLRLIAEGYATRTIAQRLGLSVKTVETHRMHLMKRLGTRNVAALVRYAVRIGLVEQEP